MGTHDIHAYMHGQKLTAVVEWIKSLVTEVELEERLDLIEGLGVIMLRFEAKHDFLLLEQHGDTGWLELTIQAKVPDSVFSKWDSIQLGERLVDDLGGITLVDCGGKYVHPLAPYNLRISADKLELVELSEKIGDPFDETHTQLIKMR